MVTVDKPSPDGGFFESSDGGVGLDISGRDFVFWVAEKYTLGMSKDFKKADNGVLYTADKACPDKTQNNKFNKIIGKLKGSIESDGFSVEDIIACYKEKLRDRVLVIFSVGNGFINRYYFNNVIGEPAGMCFSDGSRSLIRELASLNMEPSYEIFHPLINMSFKKRESYLKASVLFASFMGGLTVKQMIHISNLSVNFNASGQAVEKFLRNIRCTDLVTRSLLLEDEINNSSFVEIEKNNLLADWLYLVSVGNYDEKQTFLLKERAAKILNIDEDVVFTAYNTISKGL